MPPRPSSTSALLTSATSSSTAAHTAHNTCSSCLRKQFHASSRRETRLRRQMFAWLDGPGESFRHPLPRSTNYLSAYDRQGKLLREGEDTPEDRNDLRPFPLNQHFVSEAILSEDLRNEIWRRVIIEKKSVRTVSVELGVEMRRVGAVVRLVELERRQAGEGLPTAYPYARAVHAMLPTTPYDRTSGQVTPHESINDLPVHSLTQPQIFYPTSESRAFNRTDAGRVFSAAPRLPSSLDAAESGNPIEPWEDTTTETVGKGRSEIPILKPADSRIPHPHLVAYAKDQGDPELRGDQDEIKARYAARLLQDAAARDEARQKRIEKEEKSKTRVDTQRWQFVVKDVKVSRLTIGPDGKGKGPGMRYGVPHEDRKKGQIKIPTRVEV